MKLNKIRLSLFALFAFVGGIYISSESKILGSEVVTTGDFRLSAKNKWDASSEMNYVDLDWDSIPNLTQSGYQLYQSEDGKTWNNRSLNYSKSIKVLNIYPDIPQSNSFKSWMDSLNLKAADGSNLIQVTPVSLSDYNNNPDSYLKDSKNEYQYDVLMFGSWDANNSKDISQKGADATKLFLETGRGILFGHDTIYTGRTLFFKTFKDYLGVESQTSTSTPENYYTGSTQVKLINNGYLMKYPFEMKNDVVLTIPYAHSIDLQVKNVGTTWLEFINPSGNWPYSIYDNGTLRGGWYLKTNNNIGMIQTGHSNGASTMDERKIIANTLYNLAQVSSDNKGEDYSVQDTKPPLAPEMSVSYGEDEEVEIELDSLDKGKEYQWYVTADSKTRGTLTSDVVKETIKSNIAGYFYEVTDSQATSLYSKVENLKDAYGRIPKNKFDKYIAPDDNSTEYETKSSIDIDVDRTSQKYLHVLSVDRAGNISEVTSEKLEIVLFKSVTTVDVTPPATMAVEKDKLSLSVEKITNATKQIKGTVDLYDERDAKMLDEVYIVAKINDQFAKDAVLKITNNGKTKKDSIVEWILNLPRYIQANETIEIYAKDVSDVGDLQDKDQLITHSQEPNEQWGNLMPTAVDYDQYKGYHDAVKNSGKDERFNPAVRLTVEDVVPKGLTVIPGSVTSSTKVTDPKTNTEVDITRIGSRLTYTGKIRSAESETDSKKIIKDVMAQIIIPEELDANQLTYSFKKKKIADSEDAAKELKADYETTSRTLSTKKEKVDLRADEEIIFTFSSVVTSISEGASSFNVAVKAQGFSLDEEPFVAGDFIPENRRILTAEVSMRNPMPKNDDKDSDEPDPVIEDGNAYVRLAVVNKRLTVYHRNVNKINIKIDGDLYKTYTMPLATAEKSFLVDMPLDQHRRNITADYYYPDPNGSGNMLKGVATWNKGKWDPEVNEALNE